MIIKIIRSRIRTIDKYHSFVGRRIRGLRPDKSNCLGTGLFCTGEINKDIHMWGKEANFILGELGEIEKPQKGALIAWERNWETSFPYYSHLGIISRVDPILVTNRDGMRGPIIHDQSLEEINEGYLCENTRTKYLMPRRLKDLLR